MALVITERFLEPAEVIIDRVFDPSTQSIPLHERRRKNHRLILRPNHIAVLPFHFAVLKPESPCAGLFVAIQSWWIASILSCTETGCLAVTVLGSLQPPSFFRRQIELLREGKDGPVQMRLSFVRRLQEQDSLDAWRNRITDAARSAGVTLLFGSDIVLERIGAVTIDSRDQSVQVLYLPNSTRQGDLGLFIKMYCCPDDPQDGNRLKNRDTMTCATLNLKAMLGDIQSSQLFLGYDGTEAVFEVRLGDKERQVIAAVRRRVSDVDLLTLCQKLAGCQHYINEMIADGGFSGGKFSSDRKRDFEWLVALCDVCARDGGMWCAGCLGACYCCVEHRDEDWKAHKSW